MRFRIDLKIFAFIILFAITSQIKIYALAMIFAIIHELAHLIIGIVLKFKPDKLELNPLGLTISFKINLDDYNKKIQNGNKLEIKKILVATAGPFINLIIAFIFYRFNILPNINQTILYVNILIAIFNLLPIYPLDGGRILKGILNIKFGRWNSKKYINDISIITVIILTAITSIGIYYYQNIAILIIIIFLWAIVIKENTKLKKQINIYNVIKTIENK